MCVEELQHPLYSLSATSSSFPSSSAPPDLVQSNVKIVEPLDQLIYCVQRCVATASPPSASASSSSQSSASSSLISHGSRYLLLSPELSSSVFLFLFSF